VVVARPNVIRYSASDEGRADQKDFIANVLDISLEPLSVLRKEVRAWDAESDEDCNGHYEYWDWRTFGGEDRLFGTRGSRCSGARSQIIPHVMITGEDAFVRGGWKRVALGDCSMRVGGDSASLRVLLAGKETLFVEVTDDRFVPSGAASDRLVLEWPDAKEGPKAMHIALSGHADIPFDVHVAVVNATTRRYQIGIYEPVIRVTYEDSDDGKTVRERVSSASEGGWSLVRWIDEDSAVCTTRDGSLQVDRKPLVMSPTEPLYRD
jgi:hypothetical protein